MEQQVVEGRGCIALLGSKLREQGSENVFLVSGHHFTAQAHKIAEGLATEINITLLTKTGTDVTDTEAAEACRQFRLSGCDTIIAIGGGSVIDLAKMIIYQGIQENFPKPRFIAAPTTAGSGSEATPFAVLYKKSKKVSITHQQLLPSLVFLDADLTCGIPPYQAACAAMDALAQAIESYWNRYATTASRALAATAIKGIMTTLLSSLHGQDDAAKEQLLYAAHLAGKAIHITRTTGPHALSYYLTAIHGVPHGHATGLLLPLFFVYNNVHENAAALQDLFFLLNVRTAETAAARITELMKKAGLATTLAELGINKYEIADALLDEVNEERFANNPVPFNRAALKTLILSTL